MYVRLSTGVTKFVSSIYTFLVSPNNCIWRCHDCKNITSFFNLGKQLLANYLYKLVNKVPQDIIIDVFGSVLF